MKDERTNEQPVVFIVDDDASLRESLADLFRSVGLLVRPFPSTREFMQSQLSNTPSCLVLDVRLPGVSGLDFQTDLAEANIHIPIIFMTGHGDIPMSVRAMKAGAIEFLAKPFRDQDMLDAVQLALAKDRGRLKSETGAAELKSRFESLTPREREIMGWVAAGLMNKQIGAKVGLSEITVKVHRGNAMRKMGAKSLAEFVRMAETMGVRRTPV